MTNLSCYSLFFCLFLSQIIAQPLPRFTGGDEAYVWAGSGLNMRPNPGTKSTPIKQLPFGTKITILDFDPYDLFRYVDSIPLDACGGENEDKEYGLSGYWIPVLAGQDTGYVFSGYLGRYSPPQVNNKGFRQSFAYYAKEVFGEPRVLVAPNPDHQQLGTNQVYARYAYPNGVLYEMSYQYGADEQIVLPNTSMSEAYLLMNLFISFDAFYFSDSPEERKFASLCLNESGMMLMRIDLMSVQIVEMGNLVIISIHVDGC